MNDIFEYTDYREFLKDYVYAPARKRGEQALLAKAMGCQAAYLSQVVGGKAELTEDHAIKLTVYLNYTSMESEYFLVLVRLARASSNELKTYLEKSRLELLQKKAEISSHIKAKNFSLSEEDLRRYFCSWIPSTIHLATSSADYQTVDQLAQRLNLSPEKIKETLLFLKEMGLVTNQEDKWKFSGGSVHLPKSSTINNVHQVMRRHQAIRSIEVDNPDDLHFSSVFTISQSDLGLLRQIFLRSIEESHKCIHASGTEEIYGITLDLFKV